MKKLILLLAALACTVASAQTAIVKDTTMLTYGYSDPDMVARTSVIYPYQRYQKFEFEGVERSWKMVVLENDYLRVKIFPQIGGKIWSVYDKTRGKELFYDNGVVKFRQIALRGPWTSGGIEFNYGVIGHAPSCSHPVDYKIEHKDDGSVSCYVGVQELLTRTRWMVEINLPKDAVWVRTRSFWHNYSGNFQPYYNWFNSGVEVSDDFELIYPANYFIRHDGITEPYPYNDGHDLSKYSAQNYGEDKSFHMGGSHKGFFGAYWADADCGMLHYSARDEKIGRKYFTWAQSEEGSIWVDLLADDGRQYVELQSGRLFNQNNWGSVETPYKQFLFSPYGTDEWNEYWLPFSDIGPADDMTLRAVVGTSRADGCFTAGIYPLRDLEGELVLNDASGNVIDSRHVSLKASQAVKETFETTLEPALITLGGHRIWSSDSQLLDRPHRINPEFDAKSAQGLAIQGRYFAGQREWDEADRLVSKALELDPSLIDALNLKSMLLYRRMDYAACYSYADKVLAVDEYNPQANYTSAMAAWRLGKIYDAMDRFEVAAITLELRSAAQTALAGLHLAEGDAETAREYALKSLVGNQHNVTALHILYQCQPEENVLEAISALDPLSHFPSAERYLAGTMTAGELYSEINEELKWQNYLELAAWYHKLGLDSKASRILDACPEDNALLAIWKAYLANDPGAISLAEKENIEFVFPFREESALALQWAVDNGGGWQSRYLLAMLMDFTGNKDEAAALMSLDDSDFAAYYGYRYTLSGKRTDMEKALKLNPREWRYVQDLADIYCEEGNFAKAIDILQPYCKSHPDNFQLGTSYVKALMGDGQYAKADKVMSGMRFLPFEGMNESHDLYRDIKLSLARKSLADGKYARALEYVKQAREWPSRLGVGKPYDDIIDSSAEDALEAEIKSN